MRGLNSRFLADQRGSIFIEMIFFLPVIILIWVLLNFIYDAKKAAVVTQKSARECAWRYAINGCTGGLPAHCQGGSPSDLPDNELESAANNAFQTLSSGVSGTSVNFDSTHGRGFDVTREVDITRPNVLGGSTTAEGRMATMCGDDPRRKWTTDEVFLTICRQHGKSSWCGL